MLRKYYRILPYLLLAIFVASVFSVFFGHVTIQMMELLDLVLKGNMEAMLQRAPEIILKAILLVPLVYLQQ